MNAKQRLFADEYLKTRNITAAYKTAYATCKSDKAANSSGRRLLENAGISEYIQARLQELQSAAIAETAEIMQYYTSVMRGETKDKFIDKDGNTIEVPARLSERTAAAEKLARMLGADRAIDAERLKLDREKLEIARKATEQEQEVYNPDNDPFIIALRNVGSRFTDADFDIPEGCGV